MARSTAALSRLGSLVGGVHASGGLCASATSNAGGIPWSLLASRHFSEASPPERTSFGNLQDKVRRLDYTHAFGSASDCPTRDWTTQRETRAVVSTALGITGMRRAYDAASS